MLLDQVGDRVEHVLAVVEHQQQLLRAAGTRRATRSSVWPARAASPRTPPRTRRRTPSGSRTAASSHNHAPSRNRGSTSAATCSARRVLPTPPTPVSVTSRASPTRPSTRGDLALAADERRHLQRQVPRERVQRAQRRELARRAPGARTWNTRSGTRQVAQPVLTQVDEVDALGQRVARELRRRLRAHDLAAVRDAPSAAPHGSPTGRSSRRRAPPPRRCARPSAPATAPVTGHGSPPSACCAATAATTASSAVANAAWNPSPVVLTTYPPCASIASRSSSSWRASAVAHRVGMLLPQARRTLDVGEQERDRPRRQLRHPAPSPTVAEGQVNQAKGTSVAGRQQRRSGTTSHSPSHCVLFKGRPLLSESWVPSAIPTTIPDPDRDTRRT